MALSSLWRFKTKLNKNKTIIKLKTMNTEKNQVPQCDKTAVSSSFFVPKNAQEWLKNGEKGISSKVIFGAITGLWLDNYDWTPADPSDFNRCYKLIKQVPEWRQELYKVSLISKEWKNVVDNWDKLSEMLENRDKEMYSFMKTLGC